MSEHTPMNDNPRKHIKRAIARVNKELKEHPQLRVLSLTTGGRSGEHLLIKLALLSDMTAFKNGAMKKLPCVNKKYSTIRVAAKHEALDFATAQKLLEEYEELKNSEEEGTLITGVLHAE